MWLRLLLAGLLGGSLVFVAGYIEHTMFQWVDRHMRALPQETAVQQALGPNALPAGVYMFPNIDWASVPANQRGEMMKQLNERWRKGPSGVLLLAAPEADMMNERHLLGEWAASVVAALAAAAVVLQLSPRLSFVGRWRVVLLLGIFSWFSVNASYFIWYGFPWEFVRDEFFCALFEWGLAGLAIAGLIAPPAPAASAP